MRPDEGEIRIKGLRVNDIPPQRRGTVIVFQDYALFPHLSVFENVAYGLRRRRVPAAEVKRRVQDMLALPRAVRAGRRVAAPPVGWPAAAGRACSGSGRRAGCAAAGRAAVQPGREAPHARPDRAEGDPAIARQDDDPGDARSGGSPVDVGPRRGHGCRADPSGRRADRPLRAAGRPLRRRLRRDRQLRAGHRPGGCPRRRDSPGVGAGTRCALAPARVGRGTADHGARSAGRHGSLGGAGREPSPGDRPIEQLPGRTFGAITSRLRSSGWSWINRSGPSTRLGPRCGSPWIRPVSIFFRGRTHDTGGGGRRRAARTRPGSGRPTRTRTRSCARCCGPRRRCRGSCGCPGGRWRRRS